MSGMRSSENINEGNVKWLQSDYVNQSSSTLQTETLLMPQNEGDDGGQ